MKTVTRILLLVVLLATCPTTLHAAAPDRPNILWITCEDISPNLGCYGDQYARTPVLDGLAEQGVRYLNAYGITGVCAPNRSCLITGVYPSTLGSHGMRSTTWLPDSIKCFPEYLQAAGYYCTNNVKTDYNFATPKTAWNESSKKAHWRKRKEGQPFFSVFNFTVCHESQIRVPEEKYHKNTARLKPDERHDPAKVSIPPFHPDTPESRKDWARYHDNITAMDYQVGDVLKELEDDGLADDTIVFFFGDNGAGMPGVKKWIWEMGLVVPFMVRFPEKYKIWAPGAPGSTTDRLVSFVDFAPTVLSLAGVEIPKYMQGSAFLGPAAGQPRERVYAIRDRMAERFDMVRVVRDKKFQYHRNFFPHLPWSQFTSYTEEMPTMQVWRRMHEEGQLNPVQDRYFQAKPTEELYDIAADPFETNNLANDPRYAETLAKMRKQCQQWMIETGDMGLLPESEMLTRAEGKTPYDVAFNAKLNPVASLAELADLANERDPANVPKLIELLSDADPAVRFRVATGLVALGEKAAPAAGALKKAISDDAPHVAVTAAEALCNLGQVDTAMPVLLAGLKNDSPLIRLRAINVLDRLGQAARPAIEAMKNARMEAAGPVGDYVTRMSEYVPAGLEAK
ncbi:MAG: sulfatase-like hydrolase/transferase [Planctomycetaceae bacterium]|nr:sulfatase-like hydrolase/transferase [Planctomycetaceae bacterium]